MADTVSTTIGGRFGSVTLTWEQGESLESVAGAINDLASAPESARRPETRCSFS
ncbi:MAG: hypothetical protein R3B96_03810 [Pirellulaceae bacterium]